MNTKEKGNFGEKIAEDYLRKKGYKILEKNYFFKIDNFKKGEIDIIAKPQKSFFDILRSKKEEIIHFIEVKTLTKNDKENFLSFLPEEKVNFLKRIKLVKTAESWLIKNKIPLNSPWQIDILAIEIKNEEIKISHFENVFPLK